MPSADKPVVYACAGCSTVAQLANDLAVVMDREGLVEMSCITGVGSHIQPLVDLARSHRKILALDGCELACVKNILAQHQVEPTWHVELTKLGVTKNADEACRVSDYYRVLRHVYQLLNLIPVMPVGGKDLSDCR